VTVGIDFVYSYVGGWYVPLQDEMLRKPRTTKDKEIGGRIQQ